MNLPEVGTPADALRHTHEWFEHHGGWAPPDEDTLTEWLADGPVRCPDDCVAPPAGWCSHGLATWWMVLRALDRPSASRPLPPWRLVPHADRLDPRAPGYVAIIEAHHRALLAGQAGYLDPDSGLFVQTARTLADRGHCCEQGCRHCPFVER